MKNRVKQFWSRMWQRWITLPESKARRFGLLFAGAVLGIALAKYSAGPLACLAGFSPSNTQLRLLLLGLPVFLLLWWFRTYDARQQIEKSEQQIQQAKAQISQSEFSKGLDYLSSDDPLNIDIGTMLLLEVSKVTDVFDRAIKLAFVKRLKALPKNIHGLRVMAMRANRLTYAQYILRWLIEQQEKYGGALPDLTGMDCRYQEFRIWDKPGKGLPLCKVLGKSSASEAGYVDSEFTLISNKITFQGADLTSLDFADVLLEGYDLTDVISANVIGAFAGNFKPNIFKHCETNCHDFADYIVDDKIINNDFLPEPAELTDEEVKPLIENKSYFSD